MITQSSYEHANNIVGNGLSELIQRDINCPHDMMTFRSIDFPDIQLHESQECGAFCNKG